MSELPVSPGDLRALMALLAPATAADPYPAYARWRAERPVARPRERLYVVSRLADCEAVLADPAFGKADATAADTAPSSAAASAARRRGGPGGRSLLRANPPEHTRLRRMVSRAFTPARVRDLAPRVEALTGELLDEMFAGTGRPGNGEVARPVDLIGGLALPLPVAVISELLGIPPADRPRLVAWSQALARSLDPAFLIPDEEHARQAVARAEFAGYLRGLLPSRRRSPGPDLISALLAASDAPGEAGGALNEDELIAMCVLLLVAGHETTRSLLGAVVLALLRHPAELAAVVADPALADQAVEEALRYDPPVQLLSRFALHDTQVGGRTVAAGSAVLLLLGAAGRDPAACADPGRFLVRRETRRQLAFGHGIHYCLGAPLARLEAGIALRRLLPLLPRLRVDGQPQWRPTTVLRGLEHLWLAPAPRRAGRACGGPGWSAATADPVTPINRPGGRGSRRWRPGPSGPG
jgi:cytochrome P450